MGVLLGRSMPVDAERRAEPTGAAQKIQRSRTGAVAAFLDGPLARPALAVGLFVAVAALVVVSYVGVALAYEREPNPRARPCGARSRGPSSFRG